MLKKNSINKLSIKAVILSGEWISTKTYDAESDTFNFQKKVIETFTSNKWTYLSKNVVNLFKLLHVSQRLKRIFDFTNCFCFANYTRYWYNNNHKNSDITDTALKKWTRSEIYLYCCSEGMWLRYSNGSFVTALRPEQFKLAHFCNVLSHPISLVFNFKHKMQ